MEDVERELLVVIDRQPGFLNLPARQAHTLRSEYGRFAANHHPPLAVTERNQLGAAANPFAGNSAAIAERFNAAFVRDLDGVGAKDEQRS